ncbi:Flp family type IVb pilin, partial [Aeromonas salmonicida]|uniref:Flp family type IVb pilin n=1 Tax=Aeromonas salmonicida TaxID=645 RepID=UPI003D06B783
MKMRVWDYLGDYLKDDTGATAIEYGILAAGLAAGVLPNLGPGGFCRPGLEGEFPPRGGGGGGVG